MRRPGNLGFNITWASTRETLTLLLANNKGIDQPAHTRSLVSAFVILNDLKSKVARSDISRSSSFVALQHDVVSDYASVIVEDFVKIRFMTVMYLPKHLIKLAVIVAYL